MSFSRLLWLALLLAAPAPGQVRPQAAGGDPRLQVIDYDPGQVVALQGAPGYQITVELSPDEQVQNVAVGDSGAWQVSTNKQGDHLFLRPSQPGTSTNLTVITSVRVYHFDLTAGDYASADMPYHVRFRFPAATEVGPATVASSASPSRYAISGARLLRPASVRDDGERTFVQWRDDQPLPAVYLRAADGTESLADGWLRDGVMVIDRVAPVLLFRMDDQVARADRKPVRVRR